MPRGSLLGRGAPVGAAPWGVEGEDGVGGEEALGGGGQGCAGAVGVVEGGGTGGARAPTGESERGDEAAVGGSGAAG